MISSGAERKRSYGIERVSSYRCIFDIAVVACYDNCLPLEIGGFEHRSDEIGEERDMLPS